ncbi:LLM class flavin-dependent oxidoreductase [Nonomuraea wenchangensis]
MSDHPFRFGAVAGRAPDWCGLARRAEDLGYATLLVPDTLGTFSPFTAAAAAAAVTSRLRVGTYVLSVANRTPRAVAWETATLRELSGGRFELGLGAGRPDAAHDAAELGLPFGTAGARVRRLADTIDAVAAESKDVPILVAAAGTRLLRLAAARADTVALGVPPHATEEQVAAKLDELYELAGDRFHDLELGMNLAAAGAEPPAWLGPLGPEATGVLRGTPAQMADVLRRRRDRLGVSYVTVNAACLEAFAPVVELLAGT